MTALDGTMTAVYLQQVINGLTIGSVYALIALGYTMVYGVLEMINFAHGDVYMVGSFVGLLVLWLMGPLAAAAGGGLVLVLAATLVGAMASCALLGVGIERVAYRPLRGTSRLGPLIAALGVSLFIQNAVMLLVGSRPLPFPAAVLGGIGNLRGAMLGGLLLGLAESFGAGFIGAQWRDVIAFGVLITVLVFRPGGLLGEQLPEKV